jgi:hypothetical protein
MTRLRQLGMVRSLSAALEEEPAVSWQKQVMEDEKAW